MGRDGATSGIFKYLTGERELISIFPLVKIEGSRDKPLGRTECLGTCRVSFDDGYSTVTRRSSI